MLSLASAAISSTSVAGTSACLRLFGLAKVAVSGRGGDSAATPLQGLAAGTPTAVGRTITNGCAGSTKCCSLFQNNKNIFNINSMCLQLWKKMQ